MSPEDVQLARLVKVAARARGRQIALDIVNRTQVAMELVEAAAAEAACLVADAAVADFQARYRWTTPRD